MKPLRFLRTLGQMTVGQATARVHHELWLRKRKPIGWPAEDGAGLDAPALSQAHLPVPIEALPRLKALIDLWQRGHVEYVGLTGGNADWAGTGKPKLWRYERHYHSELVALAAQALEDPRGPWILAGREMQDEWALAAPPETGDAWEPYPTARRILSWAEAAALEPEIASPRMASRLAFQLRHLSAHLEHHLRGNHLICDAAALVAGGAMLAGPEGDQALREGSALLARELGLQVLRDGGYAERSFQYHALVLKDALLALELAAGRAPELRGKLREPIAKLALWLWQTRRRGEAGGTWPLVNDASPQAFALAEEVLVRATRMQLFSEPPRSSAIETTLEETGWTFLRDGSSELFFDFGTIGPRDQPGHGHDDALAYELRWDGVPVVTDSGVTTYDVNPTRAFERSPMAHATISVDGHGIDEIWSSFRVGGRGSVKSIEETAKHDDRLHILRGKARSYFGFTHQRALVFWPSRALLVFDRVSGAKKGARVLSHVPLDPAWSAAEAGGTIYLLGPGARGLQLHLVRGAFDHQATGAEAPRDGWVGQGFGRPVPRTSISLRMNEDHQCLYAIVAPGVNVRQTARGLALRAPGAEMAFELDGFAPAQSKPD